MFVNDRKIIISVGSSRKATSWPAQEMYWSEFTEKLKQPVRTQESFAEYMALKKPQQDELKDVGGFVGGSLKGGRRKNENAGERHLITLDADNIAGGSTQAVLKAVDDLGCAYVVYSTRKHEGADPRLRIIFPLDVPCSPDEYEPIARKAASFIGMGIFDPTTFEAVRLMYWPSTSRDGEYIYSYADKLFLSKDGMLKQYQNWTNVTEWPEVPGAAKLRERSLKKQGNPLEKTGIVGAFCKTYDVPTAIEQFLSGEYEACDDGRYTYTEGSTVGGAVLYDNGNFLYSHHATDPAGGKLCNAFDLVRLHKFGEQDIEAKPDTPVTKLPSFKAMCELAISIQEVRLVKIQEEFGDTAAEINDTGWLTELELGGNGKPTKSAKNILLILENDIRIKGKFVYDLFSLRIRVMGGVPWSNAETPRDMTDTDEAGLRVFLETEYHITDKERIGDSLRVFLEKHAIHSVRDYFSSLEWDGQSRLDTLFIDYLGAEDNCYTRAVARKAFCAAVARIYKPGTKFDNMVVIIGLQGIGKSTFLFIIGREWYFDSLKLQDMRDKTASEKTQGYVLMELSELDGMRKMESETVKSYLSKTEDIYRPAYGKMTIRVPRQCIFIGTSNTREFLKDETGDRRFWPVDCDVQPATKSVFEQLKSEVDQIWAEAVMRWSIGEPLYLNGEALERAKQEQEEHRYIDPRTGMITAFIEKPIPVDWYSWDMDKRLYHDSTLYTGELMERKQICAAEIWVECFKMPLRDMRQNNTREINTILKKLPGWVAGRPIFGADYGQQRGYVKSQIGFDSLKCLN